MTTCSCGHLAWASRRRRPRRTPAARADAEQAMTRLASVTATGDVGGRPAAAAAATAGQSMHQMASTREADRALIRLPHAPTRRIVPLPAWPAAPG